jgi:phage repressor protein C with HTH and peptisase S24 domain/DNA-binding transcriptional regulator YiaG
MVFSSQAFDTNSVLDTKSAISYRIGMKKTAPGTGKYPNHLKAYRERAGLAQHELASAAATAQPTVVKFEKGQRELTLAWAERFAPVLKVSAIDLLSKAPGDAPPSGLAEPPADYVSPGQEILAVGPEVDNALLANDIPVLGITVGGSGDNRPADFWMNGEVINHIARPRALANAKNIFSLYVDGTSMYPRFRERDLVIVQKAAPASGDDVVIELKPKFEGGEHPSFIKEYVGKRANRIVVRQFNPKKELSFDVKEILNLFRVIPFREWIG